MSRVAVTAYRVLTIIYLLFQAALSSFAPVFYGLRLPPGNTTLNHISIFSTVLEVPHLPATQGILLWPGMGTEENYLVQSILSNDAGALRQ